MLIVSIILGATIATVILAMLMLVNYRRRQNNPQEFSAEREILKLQQEAERKKKEFDQMRGGPMQDSPISARSKQNSTPLKNKQIDQLTQLMRRLADRK